MPTVASTAASAVFLLTGTVVPPVVEGTILPLQPPDTVTATTTAPAAPESPVAPSASWAQLGQTAMVSADSSSWESTVTYQCQLPEMTRQSWQWIRADLWQASDAGGQRHLVTWAAVEGSDCAPGRRTQRLRFHTSPSATAEMSTLRAGQAWYALTFGSYQSPNRQPITVVRSV